MLFNSLVFLFLFLPVTLLLGTLLPERIKNLFLLIASFVFYAWGGVSYLAVLIGVTIVNYLIGLAIGKSTSHSLQKFWLLTGVLINILPLAVFKYTGFATDNVNVLLHLFGWSPLVVGKIILPLGISFYSFKAITYLVSVYRRETPVQRNYTRLALYISFFPSVLSGPIDRYQNFQSQFSGRRVTFEKIASGIRRFVLGLGKKVLISNTMALIADELFNGSLNVLSTPLAWLGLVCYSLQIYYDFSGYTDMAIGLGRMLGFDLMENFNFPYISVSIKEFWQRWHISLSTWLRDYIFLPIAYTISRKLKKERYFHLRVDLLIYILATSVTFLICGFWHGAAWNFAVWGLIHGLLLIFEQAGLRRLLKRIPKPFRHLYTIFFLLISWVFFRTATLSDADQYLKILFGSAIAANWNVVAAYLSSGFVLTLIIALVGTTPAFAWMLERGKKIRESENKGLRLLFVSLYEAVSIAAVIWILAASVVFMAGGTNNAFIYFKF